MESGNQEGVILSEPGLSVILFSEESEMKCRKLALVGHVKICKRI